MQSLLYLIEDANIHNRLGKINIALKKYLVIQKVKLAVFASLQPN